MLTKDRRHPPGSRARLAQISHHFLSESSVAPEPEYRPSFMPVLLDDVSQVWIVHSIAKALTTRQRPSIVVYVEREMQQAARDSLAHIDRRGLVVPLTRDSDWNDQEAAQLRLLKAMSTHSSQHRFCLIPVSDLQTPVLEIFNRMLMPVKPSLDALRSAYIRIKRLSRHDAPTIGVTIVDCEREEDARIYFEKLAVAGLRFLGQRLLYCGYLRVHKQPDEGSETVVHGIEGIAPELRNVTNHILNNQLYVPLTTPGDRS